MPVEIRELVIQAQVRDNTDPMTKPVVQTQNSNMIPAGDGIQDDLNGDKTPDPEWMDMIVERCMARMQEWLIEKSMK